MELFKLFGTIAIDNSEANEGIDATTDKAEKSHSKISSAFSKIGDAAIKAGQVIATGLAAGATAMGKLVADSVGNYAEYEQLIGGVETLFKTSADKVKEYASEAYKTAGLSANEYMETATSFSASLIQSLASHTSESYEASVEALDRHYEAVEDSSEKSLDLLKESQEKEVEAFEAATDAKIALIDKQYKENLKLVDEEKYNQLKAIDDQIDKLNEQTEAERAAAEKKKQTQKIASLEEKIATAKDADARKKAEQNLADYLEELAQKERENQRKEQIAALKEQQQTIKDNADAKKEAIKEQYEAEKNAIKTESAAQLKELKKAQKSELEALKESNDAKLKEAKRYVKEQKAILESSATTMSYSAETYQKAADYANQAIIDMSDNANKMGTDISMIQNAYQGFAKQNYTMLDNLKLGYGGTKEEMERLLADAEKLTGKEYDLSSFADIVDAIHAIQTEMGITGTTASEASTTIQGSVLTMKSAWANFITGMASDNQNFDVLAENLINSFLTVADNLIPRLQILLPRLVDGLTSLISAVLPYLPPMLEALLPGLIDGAIALMTGLIVALPDIMRILLEQIPNIITQISAALVVAFPILLQTVKDLFSQIWDYIAVELLGTEADFETSFGKIKEFFEKLWAELQSLWETVGKPIWDAIRVCIGIVRDAFAERMPAIKEFVSGCFKDIRDFWNNNLKPCFEAIADFISKNLAPVFEDVFKNKILPFVDDCFGGIKDLWNKSLKPIFTGITDFLTGVFTGNWRKAWQGIANIFSGIWEGIKTAFKLPINWIIDGINNFIRGINKIQIPDWVPAVGGKGFSIKEIPRLERGGILEKGQVGLLEGKGAEAVVPLDQNRAWISAVARDMQNAIGGSNNQDIRELKEAFQDFVQAFPDMMMDAFNAMRFDVNQREFARMVKAVN